MMRRTSCAFAFAATALFLAGVAVAEPPDAPAGQGPDAVKHGDATKTGNKDKPAANDVKSDKAVDARADKAGKPGDKVEAMKADAPKDTADKDKDKEKAKTADVADPAAIAAKKAEHEARVRTQRDALRPDVMQVLKGSPMTDALRQELKRHAQSLARLDRIQELAVEAKDDASVERTRALAGKENLRHDKWMQGFDPKVQKVGAK